MALHYRTCPFCEATCGLQVETEGREVVSVKGDKQDVFSRGFICPKAHGLKQLHEDPDRLRTPLVRRNCELVEATWDEAFEEIDRRLSPLLTEHGRDAVAVYLGNPIVHNLSGVLYGPAFLRALGSRNVYSASTVDQMPKQVSSGLMFGTMLSIPLADVDRTDHLLILGANPLVSNGSLLTAPDMRGRLRAIRERGGKVVVVDPRRTIPAEEIRRMARELAAAQRAVAYGRIGTCTQEFGTLASWLVDVLNVLTGNLDREGGAMFARAAVGQKNSSGKGGSGRGVRLGRWNSRVRGLPEWELLLRLAGVVSGQGPHADVAAIDDLVVSTLVQREVSMPGSPLEGRDPAELLVELEPRRGPERVLDLMLRAGPYGLTLDELERNPHGIDLGAHEPRLPEMLRTPSGKVELAPEGIVADLERLRPLLDRELNGDMVLIGRRQLRSNNSWMHNLPALVKGKDRCTLHIHPDDAQRLGLDDGGHALVSSAAGRIEAPVELTDAIMPGVVSIPHGWGHGAPGVRMRVASEHAGVNSNVLADETQVDVPSGNAVLNGIPVEVAPG